MFDSPIEKCEVCAEMVLLDQTKAECAAEHLCSPDTVCPLKKYFTGVDYKALVEEQKKKQQKQQNQQQAATTVEP